MLHAVIEINPDAIDIARKSDEERNNGEIRGSVEAKMPGAHN